MSSAYDEVPFTFDPDNSAPRHAIDTAAQIALEEAIESEALRLLVQKRARARLEEIEADEVAPLRILWRSDLEAMTAPEPIWEGWLYSGAPALISAPGGVGKSALLLGLAVAMFHGLPFLGCATKQGTTLYIAGEGERSLKLRLRAWEMHLGVAVGSTEIATITGRTLDRGTLRQVEVFVREHRPALVIGDTVSALGRLGNENDNAEVSRLLRAFQRAVLDGNPDACPALVHHVTEQVDTRGRRKQKSRGASAFRDDHDTVLMLDGTADGFRISTEVVAAGKQKDAAPMTLAGLALRKVGPSVVVVQQDEAERVDHAEKVRRLVELMVPGNGYSSTELKEMWGLKSQGQYMDLLTLAIEAGLVEKGDGHRGRYVRIA